MLGELEYHLIAVAARLGEHAYGAAIQRDLAETTGRRCSTGALYTTLERLESKGLIETWMGNATAERGGRRKRMVRVTGKGETGARRFYEAVTRTSKGLSWATCQAGGDA